MPALFTKWVANSKVSFFGSIISLGGVQLIYERSKVNVNGDIVDAHSSCFTTIELFVVVKLIDEISSIKAKGDAKDKNLSC